MMRTVQNISNQSSPDPYKYEYNMKPTRYLTSDDDKNIPYHARQNSSPFTYTTNSINEPRGLISPNLLKATFDRSSGNTLSKVQTQVYSELNSNPTARFSNLKIRDSPSPTTSYEESGLFNEDVRDSTIGPYQNYVYGDDMKRSSNMKNNAFWISDDIFVRDSASPDLKEDYLRTEDSDWLRKQQKKLRERKEKQEREQWQPSKVKMLSELKSVQLRHRHIVDDATSEDEDEISNSRSKNKTTLLKYNSPYMEVERIRDQYIQKGWYGDNNESDNETSTRPETPGFPVHTNTPYSNLTSSTAEVYESAEQQPSTVRTDQYSDTNETWHFSPSNDDRGSGLRNPSEDTRKTSSKHHRHEVSAANVKIARDTSKYWYKPTISREEVIRLLSNQPPGTFLVRNSNSFPGAFGLAVKVSQVPAHVSSKSNNSDELIRHFLIEPSTQGVRLKGSQHEPVFSSLSALIYQHSITEIALPCCLRLPEGNFRYGHKISHTEDLYIQGAACNVLYICSKDTESLTGPEAMKQAIAWIFQKPQSNYGTVVHFKVDGQGITLTDNKRKVFFRRHYPISTVTYCGICPEHKWLISGEKECTATENPMFAFVARKPNGDSFENQCHVFVEIEPDQPATAIVNFINRMIANASRSNLV